MITKAGLKTILPYALALAGAAAALTATASLAGNGWGHGRELDPDQCLSRPLDQTRIVDSRTLYVDDYHGRAALLHMTTQCLNDFNEAIGLKFEGTDRICGPMDVEITDSVFTTRGSCQIESVEALDKDRAKAYRNGK